MSGFSTRSDDEGTPMTPDYSPPQSPPPILQRSRRFNENSAPETRTRKIRQVQTKTYSGDIKYKGQLLRGVPHGEGRMKWPNGEAYVGSWKKGKRHGNGKMRYEDPGLIYIGRWINDDMHEGTMKFPDGIKYTGYFKDGSMYGLGTMTWPNGNTHTGEFRNDERNGEGTYRVFDENKRLVKEYIGNWENDKKSGYGVMNWPQDGDNYTGEWKDNNRHGRGIMREKMRGNETVYEGNWEDDRKKGRGVFTYPATDMTYNSTWNDDVMIEAEVNKKGYPILGVISTLNSDSSIPTSNGYESYPRYQADLQYLNGDHYNGVVILYKDGRLLKYGQGTLNKESEPSSYDEVPRPPVVIPDDDDDYFDGGKKATRKRRPKLNRKSRSYKN
jgi:hypothetical protein